MFQLKCIYCKNFSTQDGCILNLDDENCERYERVCNDESKTDEPRCENCTWYSNGYCDFDENDAKVCRRFKSLSEDL